MKLFNILIISAMLFILNCKTANVVSNTTVLQSDDYSITLDVNGGNPEYVAIFQLLFRGFPNSNQTTPLISTSEESAKLQFPEYFKKFINENRYKTFITSSSKNKNGSHTIVINTKALKSDLEQNSIIRKFGY